jgi:hypothetical protein
VHHQLRLAFTVMLCAVLATGAAAPVAKADPSSGERTRITVKSRLTGWVARRDGYFLYRQGTTARMMVTVWPDLRGEPVRARLEWRRAGAKWLPIEVTSANLNRDSRALFLVRSLPAGFSFRLRARVPPGSDHRSGRSPWRYFRAI